MIKMIYVTFDKYLHRNLFTKNESVMLKYLRRYDRKLFESYIKQRKTIVCLKYLGRKSPEYNYELGGGYID